MADNPALLAAIFSAAATACAAYATWSAPRAAAKLAEALRRDAERHDQRQRQKLAVFATLMQERADISSENSVRALNLIDIAFNDSRTVREAWAELYLAFSTKPYQQPIVDERLRRLLAAVAKDIGIADELRTDDLGRVYIPVVQAQDRFIKNMQRQQLLANLQSQSPPAASATGSEDALWPPRPD